MSLFQALVYFVREAALNLFRGWKVSLLVAVTIGVSLFVGGLFLLLSSGVARSVAAWRSDARVVAYLSAEAGDSDVRAISEEARRAPWVRDVELVSAVAARSRFETAFPGLAELLESDDPLPASIELALDESRLDPARFEDWLDGLRARPEIVMVDDDRQWLRQVDRFATLLRLVGLGLGGLLLIAAVLTTASVIRLTAHVYRQEISVLRLVGGTDFFIRGPFVVEGALQGLLGGLLAALTLMAAAPVLRSQGPGFISSGFLAPVAPSAVELLGIVAAGAASGLVGAILSLRRQSLDL